MTTITAMSTSPEDWGLCPTTVRAEFRDLVLPHICEGCRGNKVRYDYFINNLPWGEKPREYLKTIDQLCEMLPEVEALYQAFLNEPRFEGRPDTYKETGQGYSMDTYKPWDRESWLRERYGTQTVAEAIEVLAANNWVKNLQGSHYSFSSQPCQDCIGSRGKPTGKVSKLVENVKCNVHYPAWPEGTKFDGRYGQGGCTRCDACAKSGITTGTIPVLAKGSDGHYHGLFVGNACVKKFGFKKFKTLDEQATKHTKTMSKKFYSKDTSEYFKQMVVEFYQHTYSTLDGVDVEAAEQN